MLKDVNSLILCFDPLAMDNTLECDRTIKHDKHMTVHVVLRKLFFGRCILKLYYQ